jgi:hypothetical protein
MKSVLIARTLRVLRGVPLDSNDRSYLRVSMLRVIATHLRRNAP